MKDSAGMADTKENKGPLDGISDDKVSDWDDNEDNKAKNDVQKK